MAEIKFYHVANKASLPADISSSQYKDGVIFIKDKKQIYAQGAFFGVSDDDAALLESLKTVKSTVEGLKIIKGVKVGTNTILSPGKDGILEIVGTGGINASINEGDGSIQLSLTAALTTGKTAGTINWNGTDVPVNGLKSAAYKEATEFETAGAAEGVKTELTSAINNKVSQVTGTNAIGVTTGTTPEVSLKIDSTQGENVTVTQSTAGLKVAVDLSAFATTSSIASKSNGIDVDKANGIKIGLNLDNATGTATNSYPVTLVETAKGLQATIDLTSFKNSLPDDLVVKSGKLSEDGKKLTLTLSNNSTVDIDVAKLVDIYEAGNGLKANDDDPHTFEVRIDSTTENFLTVGANGVKLSGVQNAINAAKEAVGNYTVNGNAISGNPTLDGTDIALTGYTQGEDKSAIAATDTINEAIAKLENRVTEAKSTADSAVENAGVKTIGGKGGDIKLKAASSTAGDVNLSVDSSNNLVAVVQGIGDTISKANSALQTLTLNDAHGADNTVKLTVVQTTTTADFKLEVCTKNVADATDASNGLAMANDVKNYVTQKLSWEEIK